MSICGQEVDTQQLKKYLKMIFIIKVLPKNDTILRLPTTWRCVHKAWADPAKVAERLRASVSNSSRNSLEGLEFESRSVLQYRSSRVRYDLSLIYK